MLYLSMTSWIVGIDEAGRGPVLGPMVLCACAVPLEKMEALARLGVKDSKMLTPQQREGLVEGIRKLCAVEVVISPPSEIDSAVLTKGDSLNLLEARHSAELINKIGARRTIEKAVIDCPSTNIPAYTKTIEKMLKKETHLLCEYKADANHPIVAASSIIAKVTRDAEIARIREMLGEEIGSGYPADPLTASWLRANYTRPHGFVRKSWSSVQNLVNKNAQRGLFEFAPEHKAEVAEFEALLAHGFRFEEPHAHEVVRMKGPGELPVTIIKFTTGKLLVQGADAAKKRAHALLQSVGLQ